MIKLDLQGFDEAVEMFAKLGEVGKAALMDAMTETGIEAASQMQVLLTPSVFTGRLRSSVHYESPKTKLYTYRDKRGRGFNGGFNRKPTGLMVAWCTNVEYADKVNQFSRKSPKFFENSYNHAESILPTRLRVNYEKAINRIVK